MRDSFDYSVSSLIVSMDEDAAFGFVDDPEETKYDAGMSRISQRVLH